VRPCILGRDEHLRRVWALWGAVQAGGGARDGDASLVQREHVYAGQNPRGPGTTRRGGD
jgi:hypothetical protein